jgi:N-acetylglutamate synthase-like GNAT family acetyltransferase
MEAPVIRLGRDSDIDWLKTLADRYKNELGFVRRGALFESIKNGQLMVAERSGQKVGFIQFHHRRDGQTTIHNIIVAPDQHGKGIGSALISYLSKRCRALGQHSIALKCPVNLNANSFYERVGFTIVAQEPGKLRSLNIWRLSLSLTADTWPHEC